MQKLGAVLGTGPKIVHSVDGRHVCLNGGHIGGDITIPPTNGGSLLCDESFATIMPSFACYTFIRSTIHRIRVEIRTDLPAAS
jgi:hypothetical protein